MTSDAWRSTQRAQQEAGRRWAIGAVAGVRWYDWIALTIATLVAMIVLAVMSTAVGCGNDLVVSGMLPSATVVPTGTPGCLQTGSACTLSTDCCSGQCISPDGITLECL